MCVKQTYRKEFSMRYIQKEMPTYEKVRQLPIGEMLLLNMLTLLLLEQEIKEEIRRAKLSLKWVQGAQRVKEEQGGQNG